MKKALAVILALTLATGLLSACGSGDTAEPTPVATPETTEPTAEPTAEAQSNIYKALALINTFATGDTETARELLDENYIQHNLAYGTGEDAFINSVEGLAAAETATTVENIRAFEDGDYVFLQSVYNFAGAGELVEHFLYDVMQGNNPDKTASYFDGDTYIQHNTAIADGVSGLNAALTALAEQGIQMIYDETHMVLAQGNFVLAVSEGTYGGAHTSYYDLWRVENGKIAEHWDVMETIADESTWQNDNGKF